MSHAVGAPPLLSNRLIAFVDILGFSHQLETRPTVEMHARYSALIDRINGTVFGSHDRAGNPRKNFAVARFMFDSVVAVSHPTDGDAGCHNIFNFLAGMLSLFQDTFGAESPMRGCITLGDFLDDSTRGIFSVRNGLNSYERNELTNGRGSSSCRERRA